MRARVGEPVELTIVAHNIGGPSAGLDVAIWGPALERSLLDAREVRLVLGPPLEGEKLAGPLQAAEGDASPIPIRVARFSVRGCRPGRPILRRHSGRAWITAFP